MSSRMTVSSKADKVFSKTPNSGRNGISTSKTTQEQYAHMRKKINTRFEQLEFPAGGKKGDTSQRPLHLPDKWSKYSRHLERNGRTSEKPPTHGKPTSKIPGKTNYYGQNFKELTVQNRNSNYRKHLFKIADEIKFPRRVNYALNQRGDRAKLIKDLDINSKERLNAVVNCIYNKAIKTPDYILGYWSLNNLAKLCKNCEDITVQVENKQMISFKKALTDKVSDAPKKAKNLYSRIEYLASRYNGNDDKKQQWIENQYHNFLPGLRKTIRDSLEFVHCLVHAGVISSKDWNSTDNFDEESREGSGEKSDEESKEGSGEESDEEPKEESGEESEEEPKEESDEESDEESYKEESSEESYKESIDE